MNLGRTVFSQLIAFTPDREFRRSVARYGGDYRPRGFSCWDQFLCRAFAQFTYREGLRDIAACLRIFADFAQILIARARVLHTHDPFGAELQRSAYARDSTLIDLHGNIHLFVRVTDGKVHDVNSGHTVILAAPGSVKHYPASIYVLVAIVKKELNLSASLYQILQVVSVTILERVPILQAQ